MGPYHPLEFGHFLVLESPRACGPLEVNHTYATKLHIYDIFNFGCGKYLYSVE